MVGVVGGRGGGGEEEVDNKCPSDTVSPFVRIHVEVGCGGVDWEKS